MTEQPIRPAPSRQNAQVRFADGRVYEGPLGAPLAAFVDAAYPTATPLITAALVDGELRELSYAIQRDVEVVPLDISNSDGMRLYQRSVSFLLIVAARELYPTAQVVIDYAVTLGGFYCEVLGRAPFSEPELAALEGRMREIVAADEPICRERIAVAEAQRMFAAQGYEDKVRLLGYREQPEVTVYCLRGVYDYFYGHMMPRTGKLRWFHLQLHAPGFILQLPRLHMPLELPPPHGFTKLSAVFDAYGRWLHILGIEDVARLNEIVDNGRIQEAILVSEALHEKHLSDIADDIARRTPAVRLVLISGPSSSGKTTFARRLSIQLQVSGLRTYAVGLDDYFVDRTLTPRDASGGYDYEALEAINLPLFNQQLVALMRGEAVRRPHYDFASGQSVLGAEVTLAPGTVLIVEGIHGLNPQLVSSLPPEWVYRIYASALTQLNIDHHNRVPTTDTRLLRRIVRDAQYRGYSAQETIERWESVRQGEDRNIFPYQENADVMFNSALAYELAVLKPFAEPLLLRVPRGTLEAVEARRLLAFLQWVRPCPPDGVPANSLLREFVGGSIFA